MATFLGQWNTVVTAGNILLTTTTTSHKSEQNC